MLLIAPRNRRGVTLVEVMIALVVLLIVFMGLMQVSIVAIQGNMKNVLRDEAVRLTADRMNRLRSVSFDHADLTATAGTNDPVDNRAVRATTVGFTVRRIIADIDANHKQVTLTTTWAWQGENFTHSISTIRRRS